MDDAVRAERDSIAEEVEAVNTLGGTINLPAAEDLAKRAAATVLQKGTNDKGQPIYFIVPKKNKGGP